MQWPQLLTIDTQRADPFDFESIVDYRTEDASIAAERSAAREVIESVLEQIPRRSAAAVIRLRFGFTSSGLPMTIEEVSRVLKMSRERVNCLECLAKTVYIYRHAAALKPFAEALCD